MLSADWSINRRLNSYSAEIVFGLNVTFEKVTDERVVSWCSAIQCVVPLLARFGKSTKPVRLRSTVAPIASTRSAGRKRSATLPSCVPTV